MGRRSLVMLLVRMQTSYDPMPWLPYALVPPALMLGRPHGSPAADRNAAKLVSVGCVATCACQWRVRRDACRRHAYYVRAHEGHML